MSLRSDVIRIFNELIGNAKKISELPAGTAPTGVELIEGVQGGINKKFTVSQIASGGAGVLSVVAGTNVTVDNTDPQNPIVSASGGGGGGTVESVTGDGPNIVDNFDPANPVISLNNAYDYTDTSISGLSAVYQPVDSDLTAIAGLSPSNDDFIQRKAGAWTNRTVSQVKTDLGLTGTNTGDQTTTGTTNRITVTSGTTNPVIDISATYVGQSSITTLGTITTGVWNGTTIAAANGGTGITSLGTGVATWLGTPSWTNFNSAITGTAPYWSLASGGALTANNTISGAFKLTFNNSQSGANSTVYSFTPTLTATANTQTMMGHDFAMATVDGGFTGLTKIIARFRDSGSTSDALQIVSKGTGTSQHFMGVNATLGTDVPAAPIHIFGASEGVRIQQNSGSGVARISFYQSTTQKADFQGTGSSNSIPNAAIMRSISGPVHFQSNNTDAGGATATQLWYFGGLFTTVSTVETNGSLGFAITTVSTNTTLDVTHHTVLVDATSGNITITLPSASAATRREYTIKKIDATANTVSFTADGATVTLSAQYAGKQIQSNGTSFYITGSI